MDQNDRLVILVLVVGILLGAFAATITGSVIAQFIEVEVIVIGGHGRCGTKHNTDSNSAEGNSADSSEQIFQNGHDSFLLFAKQQLFNILGYSEISDTRVCIRTIPTVQQMPHRAVPYRQKP